MSIYAGLDVSDKAMHVCVVDAVISQDVAIRAGEDARYRWPALADLSSKLDAIDTGHDYVRENDVFRAMLTLEERDRPSGVGGAANSST